MSFCFVCSTPTAASTIYEAPLKEWLQMVCTQNVVLLALC